MTRIRWFVVTLALGIAATAGLASPVLSPFTEEANARGLNFQTSPYPQPQGYVGQGAGFVDLDSDGDPDVVLIGRTDGVLGIFENTGGGNFVDRSSTSGVPPMQQQEAFAAADYDADGFIDLYVTQAINRPNLLLKNNGNFTFTNVANTAGVNNGAQNSMGPTWGDFDDDGWPDIYVPIYGNANALYRNNGNGTFSNQAFTLGVTGGTALTFLSVWTDYDRDGDVDLYISNDRGPLGFPANSLWRNDGGTFTDVSAASGADVSIYSMGIGSGDFDNNGYPDLYLTDIYSFENNGDNVDYFGLNPLLINQGDGTFLDLTTTFGTENQSSSWAAVMFDWDNDGRKDMYVVNQFVENHFFHCPSIPCTEIGVSMGVEADFDPEFDLFSDPPDLPEIASYSASIADVDGDGDVDLLVNTLGTPRIQLFINNEGTKRNWVRMNVVGEHPNIYGVGAGVETTVDGTVQFNEVLAGGNGYLGQNEYTLHVGLDQATSVDQAVVQWPSGGPARTLTDLPANQVWSLYPPSRLCDSDGDGVDYDDFVVFADDCFLEPFAPGCEMMDFDGDSDVAADDLDDCFVAAANDCNGNGTEDVAEIALDQSLDGDQDFDIDCCDAGPILEPNPVGNTLLVGRNGSQAQLAWTAPAADAGHAAATRFLVFASIDSAGGFSVAGETPTTSFNDSSPGQAIFYVVGATNSCGSSGEEPI